MKKLCVLILMTVALQGYCPTLTKEMISIRDEAFANTLKIKQHKLKILKIIINIEKPRTKEQAIAAEKKENAVGILQIRPIMVEEVNRILGYNKYKLEDRKDSVKSVEIFFTVQDYWNFNYHEKNACSIWNIGLPIYKIKTDKHKEALDKYWIKYKTLKNKLCNE